jgi:hypothetical protein
MNPLLLSLALVSALSAAAPAGQKSAELKPPVPVFDPAGFTSVVDNPYFPLRPGTVLVYQTRGGKAPDVDTVAVTRETRLVLGVTAVAVRTRSYRGGKPAGVRRDWYAQDRKGNVWSLAKDAKEMRDSLVADTAGSWEAGKDSARAGIVMPAIPEVGMEYRQAYRRGVVEDLAEVRSLDAKATVLNDTFTACVETEEWSTLERGVRERKVYAPGLGLVLRQTVGGGDEWTKLVKVIVP